MRRETYTGDDCLYLDLHQLPEPVQAWISSLPILPDDLEFIQITLSYSYTGERVKVAATRWDDDEDSQTQLNDPEDLIVAGDSGDEWTLPFDLWTAHLADFRALVAGEENYLS